MISHKTETVFAMEVVEGNGDAHELAKALTDPNQSIEGQQDVDDCGSLLH
jgi:hypothetical protein